MRGTSSMKKQSGKGKFGQLVENMVRTVGDNSFLVRWRQREQDFTRRRKLSFTELVYFLLHQQRCSTQCALERHFIAKGDYETHMTQQSFSDARKKVKWEAFQELFQNTVTDIYCQQCGWNTWHGYTVLAIDGSKTQLPSDPSLLDIFGGMGPGAKAATAQASFLYDPLNDVIVDARLAPLAKRERELAKEHLLRLEQLSAIKRKLIIFDRGYPSVDMIQTLRASHCEFLFRVRKKYSLELDALETGLHTIHFPIEDGSSLCLTAIKLSLDSGETETLLTSLQDKRMGLKAFKALYFARWGIETKINDLKHKVEMENFSGRLENNLYQDFYASMQLLNLVAVAAGEAQGIIDFATNDANKYHYKPNINHAIGVYKDAFIAFVIEPHSKKREQTLLRIIALIAKGKSPIRPNRSIPRNPQPRNSNFYHNTKSNF